MSVVLGLTLDYIYLALGIKVSALSGQAKEMFPESVQLIASLFLILLMINGLWHGYKETLRKGEGLN
jgi:D-alanyl-lipoteichoic acid acyltransferase DltB (MBOAT superfamily)